MKIVVKCDIFYCFSHSRKSDVLVGGLFENPFSRKLVSSSIPYFQDDITWCVAKAGLAPSWLNVFIIFNSEQLNFSFQAMFYVFLIDDNFLNYLLNCKSRLGWDCWRLSWLHRFVSTSLFGAKENITRITSGLF